jgi:hypothetical protein
LGSTSPIAFFTGRRSIGSRISFIIGIPTRGHGQGCQCTRSSM